MAKKAEIDIKKDVVTELLTDFSLEMTGKDVPHLDEARDSIPQGTRINVTFLGNEDLEMRRTAARRVSELGYVPVPHIAARRMASVPALEETLNALNTDGTSASVFVIAGDPATPDGPFEGAYDVIKTGLFAQNGVRRVGISGYPDGHPDISRRVLDDALVKKVASIRDQGLDGEFITQFGFDVEPVLAWIEKIRAQDIDWVIRVGVPGPAGIRRLLAFASRFGVASSAGIAKKYGFSLTNLLGTAGPDRFIEALAAAYDPGKHGALRLHFYTFGGMKATSEWIDTYLKEL